MLGLFRKKFQGLFAKSSSDELTESLAENISDSLIDDMTPSMDKVYSSQKTEDRIAQKVAELVDTAPAALDTLNELAAALGDDANFAATVANQIGTKASTTDLTTETQNRTDTDATLQQNIDAEILARQTAIVNEQTARQAADSMLNAQYLAEVTVRQQADNNLQTQVDQKANIDHTHTASDITDFQAQVSVNADVAANTFARHTHTNKALLDSYTQTESSLADAVSKKHSHANKALLDGIEESFTTALKTQYDNYATQKANISSLSTVATSGSYNDLTNKPSIPTKTSDISNDSGYQTAAQVSFAVSSETSARSAADANLQGQIDTKASINDVRTAINAGYLLTPTSGDGATELVQTATGGDPAFEARGVKVSNGSVNFAQLNQAVVNVLNNKEGTIATGATSQYYRGDKTWGDFFTDVRAATLTGLSATTNAVITAADTVLSALGKLQKQITDCLASLAAHTSNISNPHSVTKAQVGLGNVDNTPDVSKNVLSASKLTTPRNINGVAFDGSGDVNIEDRRGAAIASASTITIGAVGLGESIHITGTTAITSLGNAAIGTRRLLIFDGALTLTHNATSLVLPGNVNIVTAAGDSADFICDSTNNWKCLEYTKSAINPIFQDATSSAQAQINTKATDTAVFHKATGSEISSLTNKATLVDGDVILGENSAATFSKIYATCANLFTYISGKLTGAISTVLTSNLTASRALSSDVSGKIAVATTTLTELNYVNGVTSSIQTQLGTKLTSTSNLSDLSNASTARSNLSVYSQAEVLSLTGNKFNVDLSGGSQSVYYDESYVHVFGGGTLSVSEAAQFRTIPLITGGVAEARKHAAMRVQEFNQWLIAMGGENDNTWDQWANSIANTAALGSGGSFGSLNFAAATDIDEMTTTSGSVPSEYFAIPVARDSTYIYYITAAYGTIAAYTPSQGSKLIWYYTGGDAVSAPLAPVATGGFVSGVPSILQAASITPTVSIGLWTRLIVKKRYL